MKEIIINFLTSRTNLTIFQCMLYLMLGYMIGEYLTWQKMSIIFIVLFLIQFITRTKAVADGMMFRQIMIDSQVDANNIDFKGLILPSSFLNKKSVILLSLTFVNTSLAACKIPVSLGTALSNI